MRWIYHAVFPVWIRIRCYIADFNGTPRLLPPALLRFRVSENFSTASFVSIGEACASHIAELAQQFGIDIFNTGVVLDFGCGCGRTIRNFLTRAHSTQFVGCDIDREAIQWCERKLLDATFALNGMTPPLSFESAAFDIVYSVSVFTHLDERLQDMWLDELFRILRPGGILIISVHGQNAHRPLTETQLLELKSHGILHVTSKKLAGIVPDRYHTTWHTRDYIVQRLSTKALDVRYTAIADGAQDYVVALKPEGVS